MNTAKNDATRPVAVVVNDDPNQLALFAGMLRKQQIDVRPFERAEDALPAMCAAPPDLLVTDLRMPGIDGWRLCRLLRSSEFPLLNTVPILVISATFSGDEPQKIALDIGANAFLPAPVDGQQFVRIAADLMRQKEAAPSVSVLIVEDSRTLAGLLKRTFDSNGYQADIAGTAKEALEAVCARRYDLAVLDYIVPDGKGDHLLDVLSAEQPECMCLMMTGEPNPELALDWMKRGAAAYLRKPFSPEYLLELCARARRERSLLRSVDLLDVRTVELRESEARGRAILEGIPDAVLVHDKAGLILYANAAAAQRFEVPADSLPGRSMHEFVVSERRAATPDVISKTKDGHTLLYKSEYISALGKRILSETHECTIPWEGATAQLSISRDITKRVKAEQALHVQSLVLDQIQDRVTIADLNGVITYVNEAEAKMMGCPGEELIGKSVRIYGDNPELGATQREILETTLRDGHWRGDVANRTLTGHETILDCRTTTVHDERGKPIALCGVASDITERKRVEKRLSIERDLALALSSAADLRERLRASLKAALAVSDMDGGGIYLSDPETGALELSVHEGLSEAFVAKTRHFDADSPQARIVNRRQPLYAQLQDIGICMDETHVAERLKASAILPLCDANRAIGSLNLASREREEVTDHARKAIETLAGQIGHAIAVEQARQALRKSEQGYKELFSRMQEGFAVHEIICDGDGTPVDYRFLAVNSAFERLVGLKAEDILGRTVLEVLPETEPHWIETYGRVALTGEPTRFENYSAALGKYFSVAAFQPEPHLFASIFQDMTADRIAQEEQRKLEHRLYQAEKLESIGRLAGGVAHDFNNMLGVILGHSELALDQLDPGHEAYTDLEQIRKAAGRSANLTRQLLTFARKQTITPRVLELNEVVSDMHRMLKRLIGESIELEWRPGDALWPVKADPSQIDQVLANLCVNARDAIAEEGRIVISTKNCCVNDADSHGIPDAQPGDYVRLTVRDTGCGMDQATLSHLFEPFFTTKAPGEGTGLGMFTVYGIISQNGFFITVQSEPGKGSEFSVYMPRYRGKAAAMTLPGPERSLPGGKETVLVVEDEQAILDLVCDTLIRLGYRVLKAVTPGEAIEQAEQHVGAIDLLLTDVVMPAMNGRTLATNIQLLYPNIRCVFMSGYPADVIVRHGVLAPGMHFLQKPMSLRVLADTIRAALEEDREADQDRDEEMTMIHE